MVSTMKVTLAIQSIRWAQAMAVKRQKGVSQCAMQTSEDDALDSVSLTQSSALSAASSQHSSNTDGVSALDILLSGSYEHNRFVQQEFQRAASALPVIESIMVEVDALPTEVVHEAAPASGGGGQEEEVETEGVEKAVAEEEEELIDWGPQIGRNPFDEESDPDYDPYDP